MHSVTAAILKYNAGREGERVAMKYRAMRQDAFAFLRGSCHLFYQDWPAGDEPLNRAPVAWICGDLHLENFGSYKGDNGLVYFDLNDFDEGVLAPATWELGRWLASIHVAAKSLKLGRRDAAHLCRMGLAAYSAALAQGKARWLERETAKGMIRDLLHPLSLRSRETFLNSRTKLSRGRRRIRLDGKRALELPREEKEAVMAFFEQYARQQPNPKFFRPLDAARRIAGTGSLGLSRYVILVEGRGSPEANYLIDLKRAIPSALSPHVTHPQPQWESEAHRVAGIQQRAQAISPAFLAAVTFREQPYLLKALQPTADRLALQGWNGKLKRLEQVVSSMGELIAWSHLRSSGRAGSAIADEWIAFGNTKDWQSPLLEYAAAYAAKVADDWKKYSKDFDAEGKKWGSSP